MIFLITYLLGYVWFLRYHIGYALDEFSYGDIDAIYMIMGSLLGGLVCILWPITVLGRGVYVLGHKYTTNFDVTKIFPGPKPIETKTEKEARLSRERRDAERQRQREINARERELDLPVTKWEL